MNRVFATAIMLFGLATPAGAQGLLYCHNEPLDPMESFDPEYVLTALIETARSKANAKFYNVREFQCIARFKDGEIDRETQSPREIVKWSTCRCFLRHGATWMFLGRRHLQDEEVQKILRNRRVFSVDPTFISASDSVFVSGICKLFGDDDRNPQLRRLILRLYCKLGTSDDCGTERLHSDGSGHQ